MSVKAEVKARLSGHRWQISSLEFSPDGSLLASGSWDKEVRIWDLYTLETALTLSGQHSVPITTVAWFPPDGSLLATGSADCTACLWSTDTGEMLLRVKEHFGWVMGASFAGNGSALATASWDKTVRVWDPATGSLLTTLNGHTKGVYSCHFHPVATSTVVCSASDDETIRIWDTRMQGNKPLRTLISGHEDAIYSCRWSPDGNWIASGSADQRVTIWDSRGGKVLCQMRGHEDTVKSLTFHPGACKNITIPIAVSAGDTSCRLWDPREEHPDLVYSFEPHGDKEVEAVAISPDGTVLATGGRDDAIALSFLTVPRTSGAASADENDLIWEAYKRNVRQSLTATDEAIESTADELSSSSAESDDSSPNSEDSEEEESAGPHQNVRQRMLSPPTRRIAAAPIVIQKERMSIMEGQPPAMVRGQSILRRRQTNRQSQNLASTPTQNRKSMPKTNEDPAMLRNHRIMSKSLDMAVFSYLAGDVKLQERGREDEDIDEDQLRKDFLEDELTVGTLPEVGDLGTLPGPTHDLAVSLPPSRAASIHNFFAQPDPLPDRDVPEDAQEALMFLDTTLNGEENDDDGEDEDEEDEESRGDSIAGGSSGFSSNTSQQSNVLDTDSAPHQPFISRSQQPTGSLDTPPPTMPRPTSTLPQAERLNSSTVQLTQEQVSNIKLNSSPRGSPQIRSARGRAALGNSDGDSANSYEEVSEVDNMRHLRQVGKLLNSDGRENQLADDRYDSRVEPEVYVDVRH